MQGRGCRRVSAYRSPRTSRRRSKWRPSQFVRFIGEAHQAVGVRNVERRRVVSPVKFAGVHAVSERLDALRFERALARELGQSQAAVRAWPSVSGVRPSKALLMASASLRTSSGRTSRPFSRSVSTKSRAHGRGHEARGAPGPCREAVPAELALDRVERLLDAGGRIPAKRIGVARGKLRGGGADELRPGAWRPRGPRPNSARRLREDCERGRAQGAAASSRP